MILRLKKILDNSPGACFGHNPGVARIDPNGKNGPAGYMGCGGYGEISEELYTKIFRNHPDLKVGFLNFTECRRNCC